MRNPLIGSVLDFGWTAGGDILEKLLIFHTEYRLQANKITYKNISFSSLNERVRTPAERGA